MERRTEEEAADEFCRRIDQLCFEALNRILEQVRAEPIPDETTRRNLGRSALLGQE